MTQTFLQMLFMLLATNGAPVLAARVFGTHGALPLDMGRHLGDGRPLFGASKTWRGLIAAVATACVLSMLFGYGPGFGLVFGSLAMSGDLFSSFIKRRRGFKPSEKCLGLDQLPESLFAAAYAVAVFAVPWWWAVLWALAFMLIQIVLSRALFLLRIRKHPH